MNKYLKLNIMKNLIIDIKEKIEEMEKYILSIDTSSFSVKQLNYIDLYNGSNEDKLKRIIAQIKKYNINIMPSPKDRQIIRSAIIAEFGEHGFGYWIEIRTTVNNCDLQEQFEKYNYLLAKRYKNTMTFGAVVNRYKQAIDRYNENNRLHI